MIAALKSLQAFCKEERNCEAEEWITCEVSSDLQWKHNVVECNNKPYTMLKGEAKHIAQVKWEVDYGNSYWLLQFLTEEKRQREVSLIYRCIIKHQLIIFFLLFQKERTQQFLL